MKAQNISYEPLKKADIPQILAWGAKEPHLWMSDEPGNWYQTGDLEYYLDSPHTHQFLTVRVDGQLAGFCFGYNLGRWAIVADLYVDTPYRQRGLAQGMLITIGDLLKRQGVHFCTLTVNIENEHGQNLYKKLGFSRGNKQFWMFKKL